MHDHFLQYMKHNGIIIPTLFLTLQAKSNMAAVTKRISLITSECDAISPSVGVGSPYNYIP